MPTDSTPEPLATPSDPLAPERPYRILSIDGGGVRGILALSVLEKIEQEAGVPIAELFDYIIGTSTGGLIALGLAKRHAFTARALSEIWQYYAPQIFNADLAQKIRSAAQLNGPKYDNAALQKAVRAIVGVDLSMSDTSVAAAVMSYNLQDRAPLLFASYHEPKSKMFDAGMSTTAAPTYFAPWGNNIDGGTIDNNPVMTGIVEGCRLKGCSVRDLLVLSVGTGSDMKPYSGGDAASWGLLGWAGPLVSVFTDGTSTLHEYHAQQLLPDANLLRLQCPVYGDMGEMDNTSNENMAGLAEAGAQLAAKNAQAITDFIKRLKGTST